MILRLYTTAVTVALIITYIMGYAWPDTGEYIAEKCRLSNGEYTVLINNEYYRCWKAGELE